MLVDLKLEILPDRGVNYGRVPASFETGFVPGPPFVWNISWYLKKGIFCFFSCSGENVLLFSVNCYHYTSNPKTGQAKVPRGW
jgi:hypothetical protein